MDIVLIVAITSIIAILLILVSLLKSRSGSANASEEDSQVAPVRQPVARRRDPDRPAARARRTVQSRLRTVTAPRRDHDSEDDDDDDDEVEVEEETEEPLPFGIADAKIGAKKRKKLEMKAEKKAQREYDEQEREERRERQKLLDEQKKKEEDREKQEEAKREEEERLRKEEIARKEHEEYLKMKELFSVEEQGFEEAETEKESQDLLQEFINYIKSNKVVLMEDIASQFKLKTQEAIDRIQTLQSSGQLTGVIDDRGKFIYISKEELEAVAKFIKQRGRVSISELVESSNTLINLSPCST